MAKQLKEIEIPFGAKDSELCGWEYTIPEGMEATIVNNKIVVKKKESEDEKIRNLIYCLIRDRSDNGKLLNANGCSVEDALAWLEKQGQNKLIDKVEPKFKVGDWITDNTSTFQIVRVENEWYYADDGDKICFDVAHQYYHLWTIQDAKLGDVLANDHHILILKELNYDWSSNGTPSSVKAYCGIKPNGNFELDKDNWCFCGTLHIHPASKEQCAILEKAMTEAGYTFDFEKKELKEIEDEPENFKRQVISEMADLVKDYIQQKPTA